MQKTPLFGNKHFYKEALIIAVPVMLQQLIISLVSLVDNFMVSALGNSMMAAVNVANQINFTFFVFLNVICMAGGIYLAQYKGANDEWGMKQAYRFKLLLTSVVAIVYFFILRFSPDFLIRFMTNGNSAQDEIVHYASNYMKMLSYSVLFMPISFSITSSFREIGKPKVSLIISVIATFINTFLNWVLIYGNLGAPRMEVQGAAIATVIARIFEAGAFLVYARLAKAEFFVGVRDLFKVHFAMFSEIIKKSGLIFLGEIMWAASEMFMTALYNSRGGAETVAGMAAGFTIANIFYLVFAGIHTTTAVLVGNRLGAGELKEAEQRARWIISGSTIAGIFLGILMLCSTFIIPYIYGNLSSEAHSITKELIIIIALYMPLWTLLNAQFGVSRAGGDTVFAVMVDVPVTLFAFAPAVAILTFFTPVSAPLIFGISKLTDFIKIAIATYMLKKKRWVKKLTKEEYV